MDPKIAAPPMRARVVDVRPWALGEYRYTVEELRAMAREELHALKSAVDGAIATIRKQLDEHDSGERVREGPWVSKATVARRHYAQLSQSIQLILGEQSRAQRAQNVVTSQTEDKGFILAVRQELVERFGEDAAKAIFVAAGERLGRGAP